MDSIQRVRLTNEQISDDAGTTVSHRRLRRHYGRHKDGILIGDRALRRPQASGPETPYLVKAVIKMPLVFALHQRGVPVRKIATATGLSLSLVRAWIKRYGRFSTVIAACCIVNFHADQEAEDLDD